MSIVLVPLEAPLVPAPVLPEGHAGPADCPAVAACGASGVSVGGLVDPAPGCVPAFARVTLTPTVRFGVRAEWDLNPALRDPAPHVFRLEYAPHGVAGADDWEPVGAAAEDVFWLEDDTQRLYGQEQWAHYRVRLTTPLGEYVSAAYRVGETLSLRDWGRVRAMERAHATRLRLEEGVAGWLLKRKAYGEPCTCLDWQTFEVTNPQHAPCLGTGFLGGYYAPVPCSRAALSPLAHDLQLGPVRGTVDDAPRVRGEFLARPQLTAYDVWVQGGSDARWVVRAVKHAVEYKNVPVLLEAELRLAPFSHPVYGLEIPGQLPD